MTVRIDVDMAGLNSLMDELGDLAEAAVRPAAQAAAQVLYDQTKTNVAALGRHTGNLDKSIYQVYVRKNSGEGFATYAVSWNKQKAPHGQLVEFGHIQRYASYIGKDGKWHTAVRKSARGKRKPKRNASQAVKDAYYVALPSPKQIPARSFLRNAWTAKKDEAAKAAERIMINAINLRNALPE